MRFTRLMLLTIALLLAACAPSGTDAVTTDVIPGEPDLTAEPGITEPAGESDAANDLANTQWVLVSYGAPDAETSVVDGNPIMLEFEADGQAVGSGGCNSFGGPYQVQGGTLIFGQLTSTLIACEDETLMQQETEFFEALESAGPFELLGDNLTITYGAGDSVLNFVRA